MPITISTKGLDEQEVFCSDLANKFERIAIQESKELANAWLSDVKQNTPVISGDLRRSWQTRTLQKDNKILIEMQNKVEYAKHVEYGHRQEVGRYVPAIGKRLKKPYVKGQRMMTKSRERVIKKIPAVIAEIGRIFESEVNN